MAYTTQTDLENAAGGPAALLEICGDGLGAIDLVLMALAQAAADGEIDSSARRLFGTWLPFGTIAPYLTVPTKIAALAATETIWWLRSWKRVLGEDDRAGRIERLAATTGVYALIRAGEWIPVPDTYPIGDGGGTPTCVVRDAAPVMTRSSLRGIW